MASGRAIMAGPGSGMTGIAPDTLARLVAEAGASPRRRQHLNLHRSYAEPSQRFLNALRSDSYVRPHRHTLDPKEELMVAVSGAFALVTFDEAGRLDEVTPFATESHWAIGAPFGVTVQPTIWHSIMALTDEAVLLEVKPGPFDPALAKEPAPWAPDEADGAAGQAYLQALRQAVLANERVTGQLTRSARPCRL